MSSLLIGDMCSRVRNEVDNFICPLFAHAKHSFSCIYSITNYDNGKIYIGQTTIFYKRFQCHRADFRTNTHPNTHMQRVYNSGADMRMEVVEFCDKEQLDEREIFWIAFLKLKNSINGYNQDKGGHGVREKVMMPDERKEFYRVLGKKKDMSKMCGHNKRSILCYTLDGRFHSEYISMAEAGRALRIHHSGISQCVQGVTQRYRDYIFKYKNSDTYPLSIDMNNERDKKKKNDVIFLKDENNNIVNTWLGAKSLTEYINRTIRKDGFVIIGNHKFTN